MRKNLSLLLSIALLLSLFVMPVNGITFAKMDRNEYPLSPKTKEAVEAGLVNLDGTMPIITDPDAFEAKYGKLTSLIVNTPERVLPIEELVMVKRWEEETGVRFDWQPIPLDGSTEKISLILAGGEELPDIFWNFGDGRSDATVITYLDQDVFLPTEDLIKAFCPTLVDIFNDNEKYLLEATAPNGHMYGFPYIEEMYGLVLTPGPFLINKAWLDKLGLEVPTTVDEFTNALKAFRDAEDLNGNGIDDEIPMATIFGSEDTFGSYDAFYRFTGAFGEADSYCGGNRFADHMRLIDGKVTYTALDRGFGDTAMYFHELYKEGLLNKDAFDVDAGTNYLNRELAQDIALVGAFGVWTDMEIINNDVRREYIPVPKLKGEKGTFGFVLNYSEMQDACNTAITTDCEFPEIIAAFVEYLISDPALSVQSNWGAVGYNYYLADDGVLRFDLDEKGDIIPVEPYTSFGTMRVNTTTCRGSMIVLNEYYDTVAEYTYDAKTLLEGQHVNGKKEDLETYDTLPKIMLTTSEQSAVARIYDALANTVDRYVVHWVLNGDVEETWDTYISEMQSAGVEQIVSIYQDAIDRIK
ncbi:MAG: extracellular solute-binding protein [Christensenellaceae bacterium]|nr:extracellular solute-binding protein [Christensenellaceae bacterium]